MRVPSRGLQSPRWLLPLLVGAALAAAFLELRAHYRPPLGDGLDGAYYFQIARQVAQGMGLRTTYSVFHLALWPLPQPATSYPLLPLAIGYLAHWVPLREAAVWLPGVAYVSSIVLCFGWLLWSTRRSWPQASDWSQLAFSSALAAYFGLIPVYVWTSARPYTEPLANLLLIACLWSFGWCSTARFPRRMLRRAAFAGVGLLAGLCYLTRFQLVVVVIAQVIARASARDRRALKDTLWLALGAAPCFLWQASRQLSLPNAEAYALLDFAMYRQQPSVPHFVYDLQFDNRFDWFVDKLAGLRLSFNPDADESYFVQLSYCTWLVPFGLLLFGLRQALRVRARGLRGVLSRLELRRPRYAALLASAWVGLLAVAPLHTVHSLHWRTWSFGWRHGMPLFYLIVPIAVWLVAFRQRVATLCVCFLLALSLVVCGRKTAEVLERRIPTRVLDGYAEVASYLSSVAPTAGTLGIEHQALGVFSAEPLYWLACWSPPEFAGTLVRELPIDRVLVRGEELRCPSLNAIRARLSLERTFDAHYPMALYRITR